MSYTSSEDDAIETFYKKHFKVVDQTENTADSVDPTKKVEFSYEGKTYRIKQGFLGDEGMTWSKAKWRYINNTWEKAPNPDNPRFSSNGVTKQDIEFFLSRNATVVQKNTQNSSNTGANNGSSRNSENSNTQNNNGNSNARNSTSDELTQDDLYWISFHNRIKDKDPTEADKNEANNNQRKKKDLTKEGKQARDCVIKLCNGKECNR